MYNGFGVQCPANWSICLAIEKANNHSIATRVHNTVEAFLGMPKKGQVWWGVPCFLRLKIVQKLFTQLEVFIPNKGLHNVIWYSQGNLNFLQFPFLAIKAKSKSTTYIIVTKDTWYKVNSNDPLYSYIFGTHGYGFWNDMPINMSNNMELNIFLR